MRLSEIIEEFGRVIFEIDAAEGEVVPEIESQLAECESALADKVEAIERLVESLNATARAERDRAGRIVDHARALENRASRVHAWALGELEAAGLDKYETDSFKLAKRKNPPRLEIVDEALLKTSLRLMLPDAIRVVEEIDKRAVLAFAKTAVCPGAEVVSGHHWRVQ